MHQKESHTAEDLDACLSAALSLTLPGKVLCMSALIQLKKFRNCGNKVGGLKGWRKLENEGLGHSEEKKALRGTDKVHISYVHTLMNTRSIKFDLKHCSKIQLKD